MITGVIEIGCTMSFVSFSLVVIFIIAKDCKNPDFENPIQSFTTGSGTFLAKGGIHEKHIFLIVFPWEPYNIFQHLIQVTYINNVCIFKQNQQF